LEGRWVGRNQRFFSDSFLIIAQFIFWGRTFSLFFGTFVGPQKLFVELLLGGDILQRLFFIIILGSFDFQLAPLFYIGILFGLLT
jgi:hypothetical protein